jgi:hypothetical protein
MYNLMQPHYPQNSPGICFGVSLANALKIKGEIKLAEQVLHTFPQHRFFIPERGVIDHLTPLMVRELTHNKYNGRVYVNPSLTLDSLQSAFTRYFPNQDGALTQLVREETASGAIQPLTKDTKHSCPELVMLSRGHVVTVQEYADSVFTIVDGEETIWRTFGANDITGILHL